MNENQKAAKQCVRDYFLEDKIVMLDESIMRIRGIMFYIKDLIFFGNKIVISEETMSRLEKKRKTTTFRMLSRNISSLFKHIEGDEYGNYRIVSFEDNRVKYSQKVANYLKKNNNTVYLLENTKVYELLRKNGIDTQLVLLEKTFKVDPLFERRRIRFETLGMITHDSEKMIISKRSEGAVVKVYNSSGNEKEGNEIEIDVNDIVLIISNKGIIKCYNLYWIVSRHSRHQAIRLLFIHIPEGEKTNFYLERIEEKYRNIIKENIPT